ncbi:hypothetical protein FRC20_008532 [Serendipita sp. 405]|nr:hypothetical protein FRC20_008532 [Serendipita sp. 405]
MLVLTSAEADELARRNTHQPRRLHPTTSGTVATSALGSTPTNAPTAAPHFTPYFASIKALVLSSHPEMQMLVLNNAYTGATLGAP